MTGDPRSAAYSDTVVAKLELLWGEGFLSPGGTEEVELILADLNLGGKTVLDLGCGIGGLDIFLVESRGAAKVLGVDVEAPLLARAAARAHEAGQADKISFQQIAPGPLPFPAGCFDLVFSKDAMVHIPDKAALYADLLRVLKPGGVLAASDWMRRDETPPSEDLRRWLREIGLALDLAPLNRVEGLLREAGFEAVKVTDRNPWYRAEAAREVARLEDELRPEMTRILGREGYETWLSGKRRSVALLEAGEFRPGHLRARKPA